MQFLVAAARTTIVNIRDPEELPSAIERMTQIPVAKQVLRAQGRLLRSFDDCASLTDGATIHVSHMMAGGAPKKRCQRADCTAAALRGLDCSLCSGSYCAKHRLLEQHSCSGLANCKEELRKANQAKLEKERCVASRVA